jgi:hypothetical protein
VEEEWDQKDSRLAKYGQTVKERRAKTVSQTLSGGIGQCPVGSGIVRLEVSKNSKLNVRPYSGQVRHCPVGPDIVP